MNYEDEKTTIGVDICVFIISLICLLCLFIAFKDYVNGHFEIAILVIIGVLLLSIFSVFTYVGIANIINSSRNRKLAKQIMDNGVKVKGKVVSIEKTEKINYKNSLFKRALFFRRKVLRYGKDKRISLYHYAKVEYTYNEKTYNVDTPYIDFYPDDLKDKEVDVYIYNDLCYVDNYKIDRDKLLNERRKWKIMVSTIIIAFVIMSMILGLIIYLSVTGVINHKYMPIVFTLVMFAYAIAALCFYLKYISNKK